METEATEARQKLRQRRIRLAAGVFVGLLVALTLLGNTLLALTLPKVAVQPAQSGLLPVRYDGMAVVGPVEELSLRGPAGWKVKQVHAAEGERVHKGQVLVTYDDRDARRQIEDQQAALQKLQLQLELLQQQYIQATHDGDEAAVAGAQAALGSAELDIAAQQQYIAGLQADMAENGTLAAPVDGIVKEVHALAGTAGASAGPDVLLVSSARGYRFELRPPAWLAEALQAGDKLEVQVQGVDSRTVEGVVAEIDQNPLGEDGGAGESMAAPGYRIVVKLFDETIRGGEAVKVHIEKEASETDTMLVPGTAIHRDGVSYYVLVIEERQGPLGNAYYASRRSIAVKDTSDGMTAVSGNLFEGERIIVESEEPLTEGERVRI